MRLQVQGDQLRNMLKSEMNEKQNLQRRMLDAKDSLRELDLVLNNEKHAQQQPPMGNNGQVPQPAPQPLPPVQQPQAPQLPPQTVQTPIQSSNPTSSSAFSEKPHEQREAVKRVGSSPLCVCEGISISSPREDYASCVEFVP